MLEAQQFLIHLLYYFLFGKRNKLRSPPPDPGPKEELGVGKSVVAAFSAPLVLLEELLKLCARRGWAGVEV